LNWCDPDSAPIDSTFIVNHVNVRENALCRLDLSMQARWQRAIARTPFGQHRDLRLGRRPGAGSNRGRTASFDQIATQPAAKPVTTVNNNNNNTAAAAAPGVFANPTPGTIVIHIGGRVHTGFKGIWSSVDERLATAPANGSSGALLARASFGLLLFIRTDSAAWA
jgi:hypothetical protein